METLFAPTNQCARATGLVIDTHAAFCTKSSDALFEAGMHAAERQFDTLRTFFASATVDVAGLFAGFNRQWLGAGAFGWDDPATLYPSHGRTSQSLPIGVAFAYVSSPELAADSGGTTR